MNYFGKWNISLFTAKKKRLIHIKITESSAKSGARFKVESFPTKELSVLVHEGGRGFESHRLTLIFLLLYLLFIFSNSALDRSATLPYNFCADNLNIYW